MSHWTRTCRIVPGLVLLSVVWLTYGMYSTPVDSATTLAPLEQAVVHEINLARTQPQTSITFLEQLRPHYVGNELRRPGDMALGPGRGAVLMTQEGVKAVDQALAFLRAAAPLSPLTVSMGLSLAAKDFAADQGPRGGMGHQGSDGSTTGERANRYGRWQGKIGENISYGIANGRGIVMNWIIDDGVPGRGHRRNLFDAQARVVGVACGPHKTMQIMCVMLFAASYTERTAQ
jgi:uncharacterized protein YkwD